MHQKKEDDLELPTVITTEAPTQPQSQPAYLDYLDGVRGWMALFVAIHHAVRTLDNGIARSHAFDSKYYPEFGRWMSNSPLWMLMSGKFPVSVFFILSGRVLVVAAIRKHKTDPYIISGLIRRPFRLFFPILGLYVFARLFCYLNLGVSLTAEAAKAISKSGEKKMEKNGYFPCESDGSPYSWGDTIWESVRPFIGFTTPKPKISAPLWTIPLEFWGSVIIYLLALVHIPMTKGRLAIPIVCFLVATFGGSDFSEFFWGYIICVLKEDGYLTFDSRRKHVIAQIVAFSLFLIFSFPTNEGMFAWIREPIVGLIARNVVNSKWEIGRGMRDFELRSSMAAYFFLPFVEICPIIQKFFSLGFSRFLGKISFGVYLTHTPFLLTTIFPTFINHNVAGLTGNYIWETWAFGIFIWYIPFVFLSGYIFFRLLDQPSINFSKWIYDVLMVEKRTWRQIFGEVLMDFIRWISFPITYLLSLFRTTPMGQRHNE